MSAEELRNAIRALLTSHPAISTSGAGHAAHAERYLTSDGKPIGFEPDRVEHQNLWVTANSVRLHMLRDLDFVEYDKTKFSDSKPNHNLFGEAALKDADLVRFKVTSLWQAARVILEVAGTGARP
jgi:hypothetical protein